jgi:hypothetical protein
MEGGGVSDLEKHEQRAHAMEVERARLRWGFAALLVVALAGAHACRAFDESLSGGDWETRALKAEAALYECRRWTP